MMKFPFLVLLQDIVWSKNQISQDILKLLTKPFLFVILDFCFLLVLFFHNQGWIRFYLADR